MAVALSRIVIWLLALAVSGCGQAPLEPAAPFFTMARPCPTLDPSLDAVSEARLKPENVQLKVVAPGESFEVCSGITAAIRVATPDNGAELGVPDVLAIHVSYKGRTTNDTNIRLVDPRLSMGGLFYPYVHAFEGIRQARCENRNGPTAWIDSSGWGLAVQTLASRSAWRDGCYLTYGVYLEEQPVGTAVAVWVPAIREDRGNFVERQPSKPDLKIDGKVGLLMAGYDLVSYFPSVRILASNTGNVRLRQVRIEGEQVSCASGHQLVPKRIGSQTVSHSIDDDWRMLADASYQLDPGEWAVFELRYDVPAPPGCEVRLRVIATPDVAPVQRQSGAQAMLRRDLLLPLYYQPK